MQSDHHEDAVPVSACRNEAALSPMMRLAEARLNLTQAINLLDEIGYLQIAALASSALDQLDADIKKL